MEIEKSMNAGPTAEPAGLAPRRQEFEAMLFSRFFSRHQSLGAS